MKSYEKYFPKEKQTTLLQVEIEKELRNDIQKILKKEDWTLRHLVTGLLHKFLDEYNVK